MAVQLDLDDAEVRAICACTSNRDAWRLLQAYVRRTKRQDQFAALWAKRREVMGERRAEKSRATKAAFWAERVAETLAKAAAHGVTPPPVGSKHSN